MFVCEAATHVLVYTPAKLNLFLEVLARRSDGYHEIETLMGDVSIYDTLEFVPHHEGDLRLSCRWAGGVAARTSGDRGHCRQPPGDLPVGAANIVHRAVARFRERSAAKGGADIRLIKRIPSAAGLGGASSDAAAALVAANLAWNLHWPLERLAELAAELGSDVPFFLAGGWAVCRGRGERIEPVGGGRLHVVVVRPDVGLATADVYRQCRPAAAPAKVSPLQASLTTGNWRNIRGGMMNRLEEAASGLHAWIGKLKSTLSRLGCVAVQMSGSGSSCFGICKSARHARRVAAQLRSLETGAAFRATAAAGPWRRANGNS